MNRKLLSVGLLGAVAATLALVSATAVAGKPVPPPPPPPTPTSCVGVPGVGVFPAMVYGYDKYTTSKKHGGTTGYDGSDMYLADSNGKCSILILSSTWLRGLSYRQIGTEARVAFIEGPRSIRWLKFTVVSGSSGYVVEPLPLTPSIAYTATAGSVSAAELSADGKTIYFTAENQTIDGRWIDTLHSIDLDSCSSNCAPQTLYTFTVDTGVGWLSVNSAGNRLYISRGDSVLKSISFLQKDVDGTWSSLRHVVSNQDVGYESVSGFAGTAIGQWDYDSSGQKKDVLAYVVERTSGDTTDIIDVTNCAAATNDPQGSCLSDGTATVKKWGITGSVPSFTSTPSSSSFGVTSLLVWLAGGRASGSVVNVGLGDSAVPVTLLQGGPADSAD